MIVLIMLKYTESVPALQVLMNNGDNVCQHCSKLEQEHKIVSICFFVECVPFKVGTVYQYERGWEKHGEEDGLSNVFDGLVAIVLGPYVFWELWRHITIVINVSNVFNIWFWVSNFVSGKRACFKSIWFILIFSNSNHSCQMICL